MMKRTVILLLTLVLLLTLCCCGKKNNGTTWQEQYDLGVRYLSDGNYEEAIIAFTVAIKIDSKRPEAYLGLADAYTGAGDLDAARKALEDGLAATGDPEIQTKLDELSARAGNLTGQPPFSLQDLEDWGYPYGIDAYTLEREGKIETGRIEDLLEDYERWPAGFPDGNGREIGGKGLTTFVKNDMSLYSIVIDVDNGDTAEGPRGLYLGMSAEAALNLFQCDNPDAIKYLQSGDENLMTQHGDLWKMPLYDPYEDEDNALAYAGSLYLSNQSHYEDGVLIDEERVILNYEIIELASLSIDVTGGVVSKIDVRYWD
jgi:response regulator receiver protein